MDIYWNIFTMHGPINVKSPNNASKWQMGFNSTFKGLSMFCISEHCLFNTFFEFTVKEGQQLMTHRVACLVLLQVSGPNINQLTLTTMWFTAAFFSPSQDRIFSSEVSSASSKEFSTHIFANACTSRYKQYKTFLLTS
jgi:hypothetical protein